MHYYNGLSAAKRIGISYKTLLRYIEKGRIVPEEAKTPTGQLVISEDQVEALRLEVRRERDLFRQPHADSPRYRQHETDRDSLPLTDTTLNETVKELGKLQARVDVQDARIAELERRVTELESHPQPDTDSPSMSIPVSPSPVPTPKSQPQNRTTIPKSPSDLPSGTLHSIDFAEQLGITRSKFDSMMKNGVGGEPLERTKIPIASRPGKFTNWFTPAEQEKARALLRKHDKL